MNPQLNKSASSITESTPETSRPGGYADTPKTDGQLALEQAFTTDQGESGKSTEQSNKYQLEQGADHTSAADQSNGKRKIKYVPWDECEDESEPAEEDDEDTSQPLWLEKYLDAPTAFRQKLSGHKKDPCDLYILVFAIKTSRIFWSYAEDHDMDVHVARMKYWFKKDREYRYEIEARLRKFLWSTGKENAKAANELCHYCLGTELPLIPGEPREAPNKPKPGPSKILKAAADKLGGVRAAAVAIGVTEATLRGWIRRGRPSCTELGSNLLRLAKDLPD